MKYKTFNDFLMSKYEETYRGNYDNLIDRFEDYLYNLWDREDIVKLADEYVAIQKQEVVEEIEKAKFHFTNLNLYPHVSDKEAMKLWESIIQEWQRLRETLTP